MFGTLRPHGCVLSASRRADYHRYYCGLCHGLGRRFGVLARALTSHDAVFLALLADGLLEPGAAATRCRCPMVPVVRRDAAHPASSAMRFAVAVQMLLADQWLADRALEGKRLARMVRPIAARHVAHAHAELGELGLDAAPLSGFEARQSACEADGAGTPERAAEPTADALGHVLGAIAELPGARPEARAPAARAALQRLGHALGTVIYLGDALDDLEQDRRSGDFNPCLVERSDARGRRRRVADAARVERVVALLRRGLGEVRSAFAQLPLVRHRELLSSILDDQLGRHVRRAVVGARALLAAGPSAARFSLPWLWALALRFLQPVMLVLAVASSWLVGMKGVLAEGGRGKRPSRPPAPAQNDAGASLDASQLDADADAAPDAEVDADAAPGSGSGSGPLPADGSASAPPEDAAGTPGAGPAGSASTGLGKGSGGGCPDCGGMCNQCCDSCKHCCNDPCKGCCDPCKSCCNDPCKGCCDPCKGCCNDPCKGCCSGGNCCCK